MTAIEILNEVRSDLSSGFNTFLEEKGLSDIDVYSNTFPDEKLKKRQCGTQFDTPNGAVIVDSDTRKECYIGIGFQLKASDLDDMETWLSAIDEWFSSRYWGLDSRPEAITYTTIDSYEKGNTWGNQIYVSLHVVIDNHYDTNK